MFYFGDEGKFYSSGCMKQILVLNWFEKGDSKKHGVLKP